MSISYNIFNNLAIFILTSLVNYVYFSFCLFALD